MDVWFKLQEALNRGGNTHNLADVRAAVERGDAQFFAGESSIVVTEVRDYPQKRVLRVWLAAGDLDELTANLDLLDAVAKEWECSAIELEGRRGWERVLDGYEMARVVLTKEV